MTGDFRKFLPPPPWKGPPLPRGFKGSPHLIGPSSVYGCSIRPLEEEQPEEWCPAVDDRVKILTEPKGAIGTIEDVQHLVTLQDSGELRTYKRPELKRYIHGVDY
jgi:hypothetical protein